ncbi:hypothetical protein E3N88_38729 [Mikania micrantha]|uniref:Ubiquinol-cytochrome c chaperone domain-containing protein n=1 Tax=Mikania micrantha TaxID=192012 RepID=A0A5N6LXC6_9ASTR|nr:hypothetical protein E3N88_38729 [Mikania micrantha]
MMPRWSQSLAYLYRHNKSVMPRDLYALPCRRISRIAAAEVSVASYPSAKSEVSFEPCEFGILKVEVELYNKFVKLISNGYYAFNQLFNDNNSFNHFVSQIDLNKTFRSKPCSLALPHESPLRIEEPTYEGLRHFLLKMMLFYSKQSKSIRQANAIYRRVVSQVDKPVIYDAFRLEKTFRTNFSMLVVHMWLCLRRLKAEGKEGVELGQYVYEIYNHDLETRVSKAGVNLLLSKWMRELEKVFYGNIVAFDTAMLPEAKQDDLQNAIWKNVFAEDGSSKLDASALPAVLAFTRYIRRECTCLSLTVFELGRFKKRLTRDEMSIVPLNKDKQRKLVDKKLRSSVQSVVMDELISKSMKSYLESVGAYPRWGDKVHWVHRPSGLPGNTNAIHAGFLGGFDLLFTILWVKPAK